MTEAERDTWAGTLGRLANAIPPVLLAVVVINAAFVGAGFWLIYSAQHMRAEVINNLIDRCFKEKGHE